MELVTMYMVARASHRPGFSMECSGERGEGPVVGILTCVNLMICRPHAAVPHQPSSGSPVINHLSLPPLFSTFLLDTL